jgi:hypothetical protein
MCILTTCASPSSYFVWCVTFVRVVKIFLSSYGAAWWWLAVQGFAFVRTKHGASFSGGVLWVPCIWGCFSNSWDAMPLFSSVVFEPLVFLGRVSNSSNVVPLFLSEVFEPDVFLGCISNSWNIVPLFLSEVFEPLVFFGCVSNLWNTVPLFSFEVFDLDFLLQFAWRLCQWVRSLIVCLRSWLPYLTQKWLSNIELTLLAILTMWIHVLGNKAFITTSGYMGSTSLKTSHHYGFPLWGKENGPCKVNLRPYALHRRLVYNSWDIRVLQLA